MHASKRMEKLVTDLAAGHDFDLNAADGSELVVSSPGFMDLRICAYAPNVVRVMHTYWQNGDCMYDPDMAFYTATIPGLGWVPISYEQSNLGIYQECTWLRRGSIEKADLTLQKQLAAFAESWAKNLEAQGFNATAKAKVEA